MAKRVYTTTIESKLTKLADVFEEMSDKNLFMKYIALSSRENTNELRLSFGGISGKNNKNQSYVAYKSIDQLKEMLQWMLEKSDGMSKWFLYTKHNLEFGKDTSELAEELLKKLAAEKENSFSRRAGKNPAKTGLRKQQPVRPAAIG